MAGWSSAALVMLPLGVGALASCASPATGDAGCGRAGTHAAHDGGVCPGPATPTACAIKGGTTTIGVVQDADPLGGLAVDDRHVYFSIALTNASSSAVRYEIDAVALPCGATSTLVTRSDDVQTAESMVGPVLDRGVLYWMDGGGILAVPAAGGRPTTLVGSRPTPLNSRGSYSPAFAVRSGYLYWADVDGTVSRVAVAGGAPETLASGYGSPGAIAVDGQYVYWASIHEPPEGCVRSAMDGGDCAPVATIFRMAIAGGSVSTVATGQEGTDSILTTPAELYWANFGGFGVDAPLGNGAVMRLPSSGGPPVAISTSGAPDLLQLASGSLYWLEHGAVGWAAIASQHDPQPWDDSVPPKIRTFVAAPKRLYWMEWSDPRLAVVYSSPLP